MPRHAEGQAQTGQDGKRKQKRDVNNLFETGDELTQGGYQQQYGAAADQRKRGRKSRDQKISHNEKIGECCRTPLSSGPNLHPQLAELSC